jgi:hypothetical protein
LSLVPLLCSCRYKFTKTNYINNKFDSSKKDILIIFLENKEKEREREERNRGVRGKSSRIIV